MEPVKFCFAFLFICCAIAAAQTGSVRGKVSDESGAVIPGAEVVLKSASGAARTTKAVIDGSYSFVGLAPGDYTINASAPQLAIREPMKVSVANAPVTIDLTLRVSLEKQAVTVDEQSAKPTVSTEAASNASALVLAGRDLDALSDNPDDLAADLQSLAGPAAGPSGGAIYIDGFSGGQLPDKSQIREVRINQNPFSPEYDKLGFARVEILTKPGTGAFHGDLGYNFADDSWNSRNPYAAQKAPFRLHELREGLSGPMGKRASFNLTFAREWVDNGNVVNAVILDPQTLAVTPFTDTPVAQLRRTVVSPRVDYQIGANNTLTVRYSYNRDIVRNAGTGSLNLASRGYHNDALGQTLQITETAVVRTNVINEVRFQYFRPRTAAQANSADPAIQVLGAFNDGGNPIGRSVDTQNNYEFQNVTSFVQGTHTIRFGVRVRSAQDTNLSRQNYAGTFTFSGGTITSVESYQRTRLLMNRGFRPEEIRQLGGGPSQFTINAGKDTISGSQVDVGAFVGDDWRIRPNLTISAGLRYETQTNIHDWTDFAPRVGVAWAPRAGGRTRPKDVIRAGFGMFYDRFDLANVLTAARYNGTTQQQYIVANPDFFPAVPAVGSLNGPLPSSTIQMLSPTLRAPYLMQTAVSYERQLPFDTTAALTYANSRGVHMLRSADVNAPVPGAYDPAAPASGIYPLGRPGLVVLMQSDGIYNQNQLLLNVNTKASKNVSLTGSYAYGRAMSNTDGLGTFPSNPYSMAGEYGPAAIDLHHRGSVSGTVNAKWGVRFNPLLTMNSGPPFNITTGQDVYGDTLFNARPGVARAGSPALMNTPWGLLDPNPAPGQATIPRNSGRGPGQVMLNMRVSRTFTFGSRERHAPETVSASGSGAGAGRDSNAGVFQAGSGSGGAGAAASRRYSVLVSMQIRNLTNHNNPGPIIGTLRSPLFGQANQPAGSGNAIFSENANNRRLELQIRFTF